MKAAIGRNGEIAVEEIELRALASDEVRIRVEVALLDRREVHRRKTGPLGHCYAGRIIAAGAEVSHWSIGDRVTGAASAPCGECPLCLHEQEGLCSQPERLTGACAEELVIPARQVGTSLQGINPATEARLAALAEPFAHVVQGVAECRLWPGDRVLVAGTNATGLMFVALAHHLGCHVTVADDDAERLEKARNAGAHHVVDTRRDGLAAAVRACPALGHGYDVVVETSGRTDWCGEALALTRRGGVVNLFADRADEPTVSLDTGQLLASGITLKAANHHTPQSVAKAVEFIERGVLDSVTLFGSAIRLSDLPVAGEEFIRSSPDDFLPVSP